MPDTSPFAGPYSPRNYGDLVMLKQDVSSKLRPQDVFAKLAETLAVPPESVNERSVAGDFEQWDSMGAMAVISMLDYEYGVRFQPGEALELQSVEGVLHALRRAGKLE